jgi:hypothetical protein
MTTTPPAAPTRQPAVRRQAPTYAVLVGTVFAICVVAMTISILVEIQMGYIGQGEQPRSLTEQLAGVVGFGTLAFVLSVLPARVLARDARRARIGSVVYAVLAVVSLPFFWCGMPGMFGATAAHLAGLTADGPPASGGRAIGLLGLVLAVVNPTITFLGLSISWIASAF